MNQFKSRRKAKRLIYSPAAIAVLALAVVVLAKATWSVYDKYQISASRLGQSDAQLAGVKSQEGTLADSISALSTQAGAEAALRSDFRVVKPGESIAVIVDATDTSAAAVPAPPAGLWARMSAWFGRAF
jgi:cell division protein FtsB